MRVVVGEPVDVVVERVQPGRGEHPGLAHAAAEPLAPHPRLGDRVGGADHQRADRRAEPLGQADGQHVGDAPYSASGYAGGDVRVPDPGAVEVDAGARASANARSARSSSSGTTAPPAKLWVFSTEIAAVRDEERPEVGGEQLLDRGQRRPGRSASARCASSRR